MGRNSHKDIYLALNCIVLKHEHLSPTVQLCTILVTLHGSFDQIENIREAFWTTTIQFKWKYRTEKVLKIMQMM